MKRSFGELELSILRILKSGERMTVKQVHKILGSENKYNTVMTVMYRLSEKKILGREKIGPHYEYWVISLVSKFPLFIEQLKKKVFGLKTTELICSLIDSAEDISDEDFLEMEKMIENAKRKRNTAGS